MEDRLRRYVDGLFEETAPTKKSVELKEEMIQNLQDKYNDLIANGKTHEAAYNIVIAGIGDISALLDELSVEDSASEPRVPDTDTSRLRSAMLTALAVMGYILSPLPLIFLTLLGISWSARLGVPAMFLMLAISTGLLVFNSMTKQRSNRKNGTMVEEFREWQSDTQSRKALRRAVSSALWSVIVALYFIISFSVGAWHITWIIFILGAAAEAFINLFFALKK